MIKFFRKIRQKLLSENKLSKYLIYAVGEILLVVIGILIALYINNLNTEKQDSITLKGYLGNISENIEVEEDEEGENWYDLKECRYIFRLCNCKALDDVKPLYKKHQKSVCITIH